MKQHNSFFSQRRPQSWSRLDNAAKIFPPTSSARDSKVFRFACELTEPVDPVCLQAALEATVAQFPFYRCALRNGFFWYYLEQRDFVPQAEEEDEPPCSMLYRGDGGDPLFRVTYYRRRINLEVYHALADGTGALHFLRVLVYHYLAAAHPDEYAGLPPIDYDASATQKMDDSFLKYYRREQKDAPAAGPRAYHLHGATLPDYRLSIIEGRTPVAPLLAQAHAHGATLTVFLVAVMIQAIHSQMSLREERRPVVVTVPVNLRNYFPSATARNFFSVVNVGYDFSAGSGELDDIIAKVNRDLESELTADRLARRMNRLAHLEHMMLLRVVPLFLKIPVLRLSNRISEREITASFSNLGKIAMPPAMCSRIRLFDVFFTTRRLQACMSSFGGSFVLTFTTPFVATDVQRSFFRALAALGLDVTVTSNLAEFEEAN